MSGFFGYIEQKESFFDKCSLDTVIKNLSQRGSKVCFKDSVKYFHANASSHKNLFDLTDIYMDDGYLINFDGRLDNREKLLSSLGSSNQISDANLVLVAFRKWGKDFIKHLVGQFSIVIHDLQKDQIYLGRDHLGTIPLYYYYKDGLLIYGTEPRFILPSKNIQKRIDSSRIKSFVLKSEDFYEKTYFKDLQKVKPAHLLVISNETIEDERYFSFKYDPHRKLIPTDSDWIENFETILLSKVSAHSSGLQKVGLSLSGGLDSNSILGLLTSSEVEEIHCYYARFIDLKGEDYKNSDEDYFVNSINKSNKVKINNVDIPEIDVIKEINNSQKGKPEPDYDATRHIQTRVNQRCKEDGCNIIFTGFDGDLIVSHGYEKIYSDVRKGKINEAYKEYKKDRELKNIKFSTFDFFRRFVLRMYTPYFIKHIYKALKHDLISDNAAFFAKKELRGTISYAEHKRIFDTSGLKPLKHQSNIFNSFFWQHHFEMLDHDIAYQGLEYRHPFMDKDMMAFCLQIPLHLKRKNGLNRYIMRQAMAKHISKEIFNRATKSHVGEYYNYSLERNFSEMKEMLVDSPEPIRQYLDINRVKELKHNEASRLKLISFQHLCTLTAWYNANFS